MPSGHRVGTVFASVGLDFEPYSRAQKQLLKDATSTTTNIEKNFKNLGIKSAAEFDLMRAKITNSYNMITHSGKASADDILRAEKAKNDQLKRLNDQQFGHQTSMMDSLKKNWLAYSAVAYAALRLVGAAWNEAEKAADYQERINSLDALGKKYGTTGAQIIQSMKEASRGLISMSEAADMSAKALNLSLTPKQMIEFTKVSEKLSDVIGGTIPESFDRMTIAAASGRTQTLAQMGIIVDLDAAYKAYAKSIGRTKDELSEQEKQQVRLNVILEAAKQKTDELGPSFDTTRDKMDRVGVVIDDLKLKFSLMGVAVLDNILPPLTKWIDLNGDLIVQDVTGAIRGITTAVNAVADAYNKASDALRIMRMLMNIPLPGDYTKMFPGQQAPITTGKIGLQTPGYNLYSIPLKTEWAGSTTPPWETSLDKKTAASLSEKAFDKIKKESEEYYNWIAKQDADSLKAYEENRKTETSLTIKELDKIKKENEEYYGWLAKEDENSLKESTELASEKAQAYGKMNKDMKGDAANYYNYQLDALDKQRDNYEKLVGKNAVTDAWYTRNKKKLDQELTLSSNDFFGGIRVGYDRSRESAVTFAQVGESTFRSFTDSTSNMLSDNFFNLFTGRMDELQLDWTSMWDSMARTAADKLADIAIQKGLDLAISGIDWLGSAMGYWAAGSWDIKRDQLAILHKGEMVVPKEDAERMRAGNDTTLGAAWGGFAGNTAASVAAAASLASSGIGLAIGKVAGWAFTGALNPAIPLGWAAVELGRAVYAGFAAEAAFAATGAMPGDVESEHAGNLGAGAFGDIADGFGAADFGGGDSGPGAGEGPGGDTSASGGPGDTSGGGLHKGGRLKLRNDEGFFVGQKGEEVVTEKNLNILKQLVAATSTGRTGGPLVYIGGNLIADRQTFDDFVEKIDYVINKKNKRVYQ